METGPQTSPELGVDKVWGDAWTIYKLLFQRSVILAAIVYSVVDLPNLIGGFSGNDTEFGLLLLSVALGLCGPVLVQGALVQLVRGVHEAERPESIGGLLGRAWSRLGSLLWASIVYGFGVFFGLIALIVPGLLAASRWCLMAPLIMLEGHSAGDARARSRELVRPHTWGILGIVLATFIGVAVIAGIPTGIVGVRDLDPVLRYVIGVGVSALTAPFSAHVLSVLYYRITEPGRPVIHPDWKGA